MNNLYTAEQHQKIAEVEYEEYKLNASVIIYDDGEKIQIGYISEIEDNFGNGFQAYVVTDIKMPDNPTQEDYNKVSHLTLLYRGSTGINQIFSKPIEVFNDWIRNDVIMGLQVSLPNNFLSGPTHQLAYAAYYTKEIMLKYPNATADFYAHSLGSMDAQYSVSTLDLEQSDRVLGVYIFNAPNIYRVLNEEERQNISLLHDRIYNYIDPHDFIGLGYDQKEGAVGQVFVLNTKNLNDMTRQHMLGGYQYDAYGNQIDKNGLFVHAENRVSIDIDGDGMNDFGIKELKSGLRNYFEQPSDVRYSYLNDGKTITIDAEKLHQLSQNIADYVLMDLETIQMITQKCRIKNNNIKGSFEERKTQVSEQIKEALSSNSLSSVFNSLETSLRQIVNQQSVFDTLSSSGELDYPFSYNDIPDVDGSPIDNTYQTELLNLSKVALELAKACQEEKVPSQEKRMRSS